MIGGEFEIEWSKLEHERHVALAPNEYAYSSGRAALFQILSHVRDAMGVQRILLPEYLCDSIVTTVLKADFEYAFYPLKEFFEIDEQGLQKAYQPNSSILIINYFGLTNVERQKHVIKAHYPSAIIIEDDVQAYYEYVKPLGVEEFKFTSLRKWFAIPDGGLVKTKHPLSVVKQQNGFTPFKLAGAIIKERRDILNDDKIYLNLFEKGEELLEADYENGMSSISQYLYAAIDADAIYQQRKKNAEALLQGIKGIPSAQLLMSVGEDKVPLFIPIALPNRDAVRRRFINADIFMPIHWPNQLTEHAQQIERTELSLIIDQRYNEDDMQRILEILNEI